jgi:hypothetical protein
MNGDPFKTAGINNIKELVPIAMNDTSNFLLVVEISHSVMYCHRAGSPRSDLRRHYVSLSGRDRLATSHWALQSGSS